MTTVSGTTNEQVWRSWWFVTSVESEDLLETPGILSAMEQCILWLSWLGKTRPGCLMGSIKRVSWPPRTRVWGRRLAYKQTYGDASLHTWHFDRSRKWSSSTADLESKCTHMYTYIIRTRLTIPESNGWPVNQVCYRLVLVLKWVTFQSVETLRPVSFQSQQWHYRFVLDNYQNSWSMLDIHKTQTELWLHTDFKGRGKVVFKETFHRLIRFNVADLFSLARQTLIWKNSLLPQSLCSICGHGDFYTWWDSLSFLWYGVTQPAEYCVSSYHWWQYYCTCLCVQCSMITVPYQCFVVL